MALSKIDVANMLTGLVPNDNTIRRPNVKPIIINGNMAVAQRGTSAAGLTNGSDVYVALDRFGFNEFGSPSSQHTMTQESLTSGNAYINGFANALKMDVTTAQSSLDADDATMIIYKFEGQDLQLFKKGTANAEKFTLAFWVKGTKTGTHVVELFDRDNNRHVAGTYSISSSDTWEHKVVNYPADTTGVFGDDNARSLDINWFLSAGTNFTSGTLQTSWGAQSNTTRAAGQVNTVDNTSNNWHITGVQLEVGEYTSSTLPPFKHETFADNLQRCQRYFTMIADGRLGGGSNEAFIGAGYCHAGNTNYFACGTLPVRMRSYDPSIFTVTGTGNYKATRENGEDTFDSIVMYGQYNEQVFSINCTGNVSATQGTGAQIRLHSTSTYFGVDAEL